MSELLRIILGEWITIIQQSKRKKRVWLKVLFTVLGVLLLLPVIFYTYLAYDHFQIDEKRADYDFNAPYSGEARYLVNGDVEIPLKAEDLYWLTDEYQVLENLGIRDLVCKKIAFKISDSSLTVYAKLLYRGILPLPLCVDLSIQSSDILKISAVGVRIEKWIEISPETLAKYGVETHYNVSLDELLRDTQITSIEFADEQITLVAPFLSELSQAVSPDMIADILLLYGEKNDDAVSQASACYRADTDNVREQIICNYVASV